MKYLVKMFVENVFFVFKFNLLFLCLLFVSNSIINQIVMNSKTNDVLNDVDEVLTNNGVVNGETTNTIAIPSWMVPDYFQEIIDKKFANYEIVGLDIGPATGKGENFLATMHRVKVKLFDKITKVTRELSLIVKSLFLPVRKLHHKPKNYSQKRLQSTKRF